MLVPDSRIKEFCRFYPCNTTVRSKLYYEFGIIVPERRIARLRKMIGRARVAHAGYMSATGAANGTDKPLKFECMIRRGTAALSEAIEREHPGFYKSGFVPRLQALG